MKTINVSPDDRLFEELGNNTYSIEDLLSELIDNSLSAKMDDIVTIELSLFFDKGKCLSTFIIKDNGSGIPFDKLGTVVSPAASITSNPLNEHGLGLKQAVASMGKLDYLATKTDSAEYTSVIHKFGWGEIDVEEKKIFETNGTEIKVSIKESSIMRSKKSRWFQKECAEFLGARYRRFLVPASRKARIILHFYDYQENLEKDVEIEKIEPVYFHTSKIENAPMIFRHEIEGSGWKAKLTFGYAPNDEEYERLGLESDNNSIYKVTMKHQGLDIIINDRVLIFHQLSDIGLVEAKHPQFNYVRGEIELLEGFKTAVTKNNVINDTHFTECIDKVRRILNGESEGPGKIKKEYLTRRAYAEEIPEACLRDRLAKNLENLPLYKADHVETEHVIENLEGKIDLYVAMKDGTKEIWEIKNERAIAQDVYQLFMYMDVENVTNGYLLAIEFSDGAKYAKEHINEKYGKRITLTTFESYNVLYPMSQEELHRY